MISRTISCQRRRVLPMILAGACSFAGTLPATAADLTIKLTDIQQAVGEVQVAVYASEADFRKTGLRSQRQAVQAIGTIEIVLKDLPAGDYAVMVFQDLNGNDQLDTNLLGIPKEPWGASLNGKTVFGAPGWADAKFSLPAEGAIVSVPVK